MTDTLLKFTAASHYATHVCIPLVSISYLHRSAGLQVCGQYHGRFVVACCSESPCYCHAVKNWLKPYKELFAWVKKWSSHNQTGWTAFTGLIFQHCYVIQCWESKFRLSISCQGLGCQCWGTWGIFSAVILVITGLMMVGWWLESYPRLDDSLSSKMWGCLESSLDDSCLSWRNHQNMANFGTRPYPTSFTTFTHSSTHQVSGWGL